MISAQSLAMFVIAGLILNLTPGPDVMYIVANSLRSGFRGGAVAAVGIVSGCFVHIIAAALGVSAIIAASARLFLVLKLVGAAYLVYVGLRMLLARAAPPVAGAVEAPRLSLIAIWRRGFLTNALNPKVALFFLAFVPQFIPHGAAHTGLLFLGLGLLFNINSLFVNVGWAAVAAWAAAHSGPLQRGMGLIERGAGALFVAFGVRLAFAELRA